MEDLLTRLLNFYQISKEDYLDMIKEPSLDDVFKYHFSRCDEAVDLVKSVINDHGKILVYGDYDCDGIMGTSILTNMFLLRNYLITPYIPNRYKDGYGLNMEQAKLAVSRGYNLVITVDNGITANEPIQYLKDHKIKVLVLDHHTPGNELPNADIILHPQISNFGDVATSGAFVAFYFAYQFLGYYDKYLATLAAISLISDMMPLKSYNRTFFRYVKKHYKDGEFKNIDLLKENDPFNESTIGMKIAPKINSIGRLIETDDINHLCIYFSGATNKELLNYINWINETNEQRKELSKLFAENIPENILNNEGIVYLCDAKEGMIGLIANYLANKFQKPTIVLCKNIDGTLLKGSSRAPEGFDVVESFKALSSYLVTYGGHFGAGGCSINLEKFNEFQSAYNDYVKNYTYKIAEKRYVDLHLTEITEETLDLLNTFAPFGEENPTPLFKLSNILTDTLNYSKNLQHIITYIGMNSKITGFNFSKSELGKYRSVNFYGTLHSSSYLNKTNTEFLIESYETN